MDIDHDENRSRMLRGDLYYAFTTPLITARNRCHHACNRFNNAGEVPRRRLVELWRDIIEDNRPIPTGTGNDDVDFADDPWIDGPIRVDFGTNLRFGKGVYVNFNCTFLDTSTITIGARTLIGPNCSFYSATHPINARLRNGTAGPELGFPITVGEDCWFGGNVTVLPNVTIGKGCTIGAGSVVTKDVPAYSVVAGNPARIVRSVATENQPLDPSRDAESLVEEEAKAIEATLRAMPFMQSTKDRAQDS